MRHLCFASCALLDQTPRHGAGDGKRLEERADEVTQTECDELLKVDTWRKTVKHSVLLQHFHTSALDNFRKMRPVYFPQSCFTKCVTCIYVSAMCHWRTRFAQCSTNSTVRQLYNAPNNSSVVEMNKFQQTGTTNLFVSSLSNISVQNKNITLQQTARGRPVIQTCSKHLVTHMMPEAHQQPWTHSPGCHPHCSHVSGQRSWPARRPWRILQLL